MRAVLFLYVGLYIRNPVSVYLFLLLFIFRLFIFLRPTEYHGGTCRKIEFEPSLSIAGQKRVEVGQVAEAVIIQSVSAECRRGSVQNHVVGSLRHHEAVIRIRTGIAEVKDKYEVITAIGQYLVAIVMPDFRHGRFLDIFLLADNIQHRLVEVT